jgi:hypothetical protein
VTGYAPLFANLQTARAAPETVRVYNQVRLQCARLQERLRELKALEDNQQRQIAYDKAKAVRDELAAELKAVYPPIEAQLRNLLTRIDENDKQIEYINAHALPKGAERLLVAELVGRSRPIRSGGFSSGGDCSDVAAASGSSSACARGKVASTGRITTRLPSPPE